ncbi:MAG TPA: hypothetical protein PLE19_05360 [Planctomycetota bacterium]|nr:hypothetical protein [Planctomycetota bacterium]HRR80894.1 hypothetical protein [Planctomycetota bacterium]HRT95837.1 hypothetical protein [Planctomycetota bacterium]
MRPDARFIGAVIAALTALACGTSMAAELAFAAEGKEFRFDTGLVRGTLRPQGRSLGLAAVVDAASGTMLSGAYGLCSHYRLLDAESRYGDAAWDWPSAARLLPDGSVEAAWTADPAHPFDLKAVYRWTAPGTLDVATAVTARTDLSRLEVFLASYFAGFPASFVYVRACPETGDKPGFLEAKKAAAVWQMFPRDEAAVKLLQDGRWRRPPHPVDWRIMPPFAGPLGLRRNAKLGLAALVMAPPGDCFAVATPYGEEGHGSLYLSLFGRDFKSGEAATARSRLIIGRDITDEKAIALYEAYLKELK